MAFLYGPVLLLVATSFNPSAADDGAERVLAALVWDAVAGTGRCCRRQRCPCGSRRCRQRGAAVLGTAAGYALARFGRFRGRGVFASLLGARLVLPDVLVGLSLLLLFVQMEQWFGWPAGRGALTITLAHVSVSLSYVAVVIEARLRDGGTDLEEAAQDLGASPARAFMLITLPLLAPALLSGWLLAFTLSLDDLVVATFVSGARGQHVADGGVLGAEARGDAGTERAGDGDPGGGVGGAAGGRGGSRAGRGGHKPSCAADALGHSVRRPKRKPIHAAHCRASRQGQSQPDHRHQQQGACVAGGGGGTSSRCRRGSRISIRRST